MKRSRREGLALHSATRGSGVEIDAVYEQAVEDLRTLMITEPGRQRPTKEPRSLAASAVQGRRHNSWCPPGFEVTRAIRSGKREFWDEVRKLEHPFAGAEVDLPSDVMAAVATVAALGQATPEWRERQMVAFRRVARSLEPMSARMKARQRDHVAEAAGNAHAAFLMAVIDAMEWPDVEFARRYCLTGFDVIGTAADTGLFRLATPKEAREQAAEKMEVPTLLKSNAAWARQLKRMCEGAYQQAVKEGGARLEGLQVAWKKSADAHHAGNSYLRRCGCLEASSTAGVSIRLVHMSVY